MMINYQSPNNGSIKLDSRGNGKKIFCFPLYADALRKHYAKTGRDPAKIIELSPEDDESFENSFYCARCGSFGPFEISLEALDELARETEIYMLGEEAVAEYAEIRDMLTVPVTISTKNGRLQSMMHGAKRVSMHKIMGLAGLLPIGFGSEGIYCVNCGGGSIVLPVVAGRVDYESASGVLSLFMFEDYPTDEDESGKPRITRDGIIRECIGCYNFKNDFVNLFDGRGERGEVSEDDLDSAEPLCYKSFYCEECPLVVDFQNFDITPREIQSVAQRTGKWNQKE